MFSLIPTYSSGCCPAVQDAGPVVGCKLLTPGYCGAVGHGVAGGGGGGAATLAWTWSNYQLLGTSYHQPLIET